jgi:two-component system phosphate regulon sensor histidine kinase PhoR
LIEALSLFVAAIAVAALVAATAKRRRFAARLTRLVDDAERLAEGGHAERERAASIESASVRGADLDLELSRFSRALDRLTVRAAQDVAAVEIERRKLDEILAGVPEGVLVTTSERVPIYANRAFRELFDVDPAASTAELLALVRRPQVHEALGRAIAEEAGAAVEIQLAGHEVSVVARKLQGPTGILLMARDVTEANRLTRMRRDFVTNLSHEIKTPLAIIRGAAETLEETGPDDTEAAERFVRRIVEQIYRLEDLLKDLLTLARLESAEATLRRQPVELDAICRHAIETLAPLAGREGVALRSSIEAVPELHGDAKALERMVLNLLVNGIQYNRRGGRVDLRVAAGDPDPNAGSAAAASVVLEVEDDGIGIAEPELQRIFERFYRVDKGRGRAEGGSGLGLAIVKHVAQSHGGSVEVRSEVERGTLFRVVLPVAQSLAHGAPPEDAGDGAETKDGRGPRLIVARH